MAMDLKGYSAVCIPQETALLVQYAFARQHREGKAANAKQSRKLFLGNAPLARSKEQLTAAFAAGLPDFGVSDATVGHLRAKERGRGAPAAAVTTSYVTFESAKAAAAALKTLSWDVLEGMKGAPVNVLERLRRDHKSLRPDAETLKREVDTYMAAFDAAETEEEKRKRDLASKVDADGFRTVVRGKKRRPEDLDGARRKKKAKKKNHELKNFYRHQMREQKREALVKLREKFEEDKAKIARMKEARKFRPY